MSRKKNKWDRGSLWLLKALAKSHGESLPVVEIKKAQQCNVQRTLARSERLKAQAARWARELSRANNTEAA